MCYDVFLHMKSTRIIIYDIRELVVWMQPLLVNAMQKHNVDFKYATTIVDWCIKKSLETVFMVTVCELAPSCHHENIYNEIKQFIEPMLSRFVSFNDMRIFDPPIVKVITNGRDLFITQDYNYVLQA